MQCVFVNEHGIVSDIKCISVSMIYRVVSDISTSTSKKNILMVSFQPTKAMETFIMLLFVTLFFVYCVVAYAKRFKALLPSVFFITCSVSSSSFCHKKVHTQQKQSTTSTSNESEWLVVVAIVFYYLEFVVSLLMRHACLHGRYEESKNILDIYTNPKIE